MRKFYVWLLIGLLLYIGSVSYFLLHASSSLPIAWQGTAADPMSFMSPEQWQQSVGYSRTGNIITLIAGPIKWTLYVLIIGLGVSTLFRKWVHPFKWSILRIFFYLLLLLLTISILELPLHYYSFHVKQAFGMSTESFSHWMGNRLKSLGVSLLTMTPIVWLFYFVVKKSPKRWWIWLGACSIPILLFSMFAQPVLLDPIYNEFTTLQDEQLSEEILTMAEKADIPAEHVFEVDMSKKTNALNAYVNGIGSNTRIVLWDTTLKKLEKDEVLFIMAHEMGHYALHHMPWLFVGSVGMVIVALYLLSVLFPRIIDRYGERWGVRGINDLASLPLVLLLFSVFSFFSMPIQNGVSRQYEHAADQYAMNMTQDKEAAIGAFQGLAVEGLSEVNPPTFVKLVLHSHPTLYERIRFVEEYEE